MPIILYRVDDRLIHGQVVEGWVPDLNITEIVIVSDKIANDDLSKNIMRFSTPPDIKLVFVGLDSSVKYLKETAHDSSERIMVLFSNLSDVVELVKKGIRIECLNIGGMHYSLGKNLSIGKAIFLNEEDCAHLRFLNKQGVKLEGRGVPGDKPIDILSSI